MKTERGVVFPAAGLAVVAALALVAVGVFGGEGNEVDPDVVSLVVLPALILGGAFAILRTRGRSAAYRWAVGVALAAAFLLFWAIGAVGVLGPDDHHPGDLMYVGVLAVGSVGAILARFQPRGMARALVATALAHGLVAAVALVFGLGAPVTGPLQVLALNAFFAAPFLGSALLFRRAARAQPPAGARPAS